MDPQWLQVVFGGLAVLFVLIGVKAARCLSANEPYTFGMWDGGMLRQGKSLTRTGTWVKLGVSIAFMLMSVVMAFGSLPRSLSWPIIALAAGSLLADMMFMA